MTQFPPTSGLPPAPPPNGNFPALQTPYSGAAIAGFVLSLLGCAGITAVLGFILGIVGIFSTRDGRRRGMGLAVAAIPISLITGALSIGLLLSTLAFGRGAAMLVQLPMFLNGDPAGLTQAATSIRELSSEDFKDSVSEQVLTDWLTQIAEEHGSLAELTDADAKDSTKAGDAIVFELDGKFTNGPANITVRFVFEGYVMKLDDIEIDGVSPASLAQ